MKRDFILTRFLDANRYPLRLKTLPILAVGGELLFQRRQFGKRRIGVDRPIAITRRRAGGILPVRGAAVAALVAVAAALVASAELAASLVAASLVASAGGFLPALFAVALPALVSLLALETLAGGTALVLARLANRRGVGGSSGCGFGRHLGTRFAELVVAFAATAAMPLVFWSFAGLARGRAGWRAFRETRVMALTVAIVARPALFRTPTGPPDFDQFGGSDGFRRRRGRFRRRHLGGGRRLGGCLGRDMILRRFDRRSFR